MGTGMATVLRLTLRDLRRSRARAALLLVAITATTTTLTLGLLVRDATARPWERTRAATAGPDAVATGDARALAKLARAPGVTGAARPYPTASGRLEARGHTVNALVHGRDVAPSRLDRPLVTDGRWLRPGAAVVERAFARALGVRPGDRVTIAGRTFPVAGVAIGSGRVPYPSAAPGLVWLTRADAARLPAARTGSGARTLTMPLRLADPDAAPAFAARHPGVRSWQDMGAYATAELRLANGALLGGTWALAILAAMSVSLLVGGRLAEQGRRVGTLKVAGATPAFIALLLLAEHLAVAVAATIVGVLAGWAAAPLVAGPNAGLLGAGTPAPSAGTVLAVLAVAVAVTAAATAVPALRGARIGTVRALAEPVRAPRRRSRLAAAFSGLPLPLLLLGARIAARRPRRTVLAGLSMAVTVAMVVAALAMGRDIERKDAVVLGPDFVPGAGNPVTERLSQIVLVLALAMLALAAVNAVLTAWTTSLDNLRTAALTRALGATPRQVTTGLASAQLLPAAFAALGGVPLGLLVYAAARAAGGSPGQAEVPVLWLAATVPATLAVVGLLTAVPVRYGATRPVTEALGGR
ncbi:FtsX-like permease family protein [Actinomadura viridis]|uniref:ABC transport system permease protein n=1 Tax=Actinomadura viridis TaxID=58110 RepID=A0A931GJ18_9ACTN|nr:FtsX-like permease family protein [Actinomadura viridis]MBG6089208.1 putative ABC transport system permease protein [Actinomadura viridis]